MTATSAWSRGKNGGKWIEKTELKERKLRHPDAEGAFEAKLNKDKFLFKAAVNLLPRAGLPMWSARSMRETWSVVNACVSA